MTISPPGTTPHDLCGDGIEAAATPRVSLTELWEILDDLHERFEVLPAHQHQPECSQ